MPNNDLPNVIQSAFFVPPDGAWWQTQAWSAAIKPPRILFLYGSVRERSCSRRLASKEAARLPWAKGMVWCSPERHGAMSGIMKSQIDWIPLAD